MLRPLLAFLALAALLVGCSRLGAAAPEAPSRSATDRPASGADVVARLGLPAPRAPRASEPGLAGHARGTFWDAFSAGEYSRLDEATFLLTAAYLDNPRDPEVTLLLAHAHLWRISERQRLDTLDPTITDHLALADTYFEEAYRLAPDDARILGWLGSARMPLGGLRQDSTLARAGYDLLEESARRYPAFNHFTAAFAASGLPATDPRFQAALDHLWANVEVCSGSSDGASGDATDYDRALQTAPVCANTDAVPHNFEGFAMTMGDLLVKAGEAETARAAYARAALSPTYASWPFRETLEQRVLNIEESAALFAEAQTDPGAEEPEIVFGSAYSCAVCHQR